MVVYAEQILLDNFLVDGALLYSVGRIGAIPTRGARIACAALLGASAALASAFVGGWIAIALKLVVAPLMVWISARFSDVRKYFFALFLLLALTACYGGACYAILCALGAERMRRIPIGLVTVGVLCVAVGVSRLFVGAKKRARLTDCVVELSVAYKDKTCRCDAFLDTGNTLTDSDSGLPVVLIDAGVLRRVLYDGLELDVLRSRVPVGVDGHLIPYASVNGKSRIFVFRPDEIRIYRGGRAHKIVDVMIGVDILACPCGCSAILNPALIEGA